MSLARALIERAAVDGAIDALLTSLTRHPQGLDILSILQAALSLGGYGIDAPGSWLSAGAALETEGCLGEAADAYGRAAEAKPDCLKALTQLGKLKVASGDPFEAVEWIHKALSIDPENPVAHAWLGRALHLTGDLSQGLAEFGWLGHPSVMRWRTFERPLWGGSPVGGRTILIWADQALGDTIQFLPYARLARTQEAHIVLECQTRLVPLVQPLVSAADVVSLGAPLPAFDLHIPLTAIPVVLGKHGWPAPGGIPYLSVDAALVATWRRRLEGGRRESNGEMTIGISWAGHPEGTAARTRFAPLSAFATLAGLPGVRFISLQLGPQSTEQGPPGLHIERLQDESSTMADTAALMCNLDLVLTVDTMIAHLAGALGRPVWIALAHAADWRWLRNTDSSPWYPTMRLFRQPRPGDWQGLFEQVRITLSLRRTALKRAALAAHLFPASSRS